MTSGLWPSIRAQANGLPFTPAGYFYAVDGTAYAGCPAPPQPLINDGTGYWCGFSSGMVGGMINTQDGLWASRCIGYPAATLPMWPSVQDGRAMLVAAIQADAAAYLAANGSYTGFAIAGSGYSQGSMVWDQVWVEDFVAPGGVLNYLLPYVYRIYQYGHVFRTPGIAWGNALAGLPQSLPVDGVETGGIGAALDLTEAQTNYVSPVGTPVIYSCANAGDIYSACEVGLNPWTAIAPEGFIADLFYKVVMQPTFIDVVEVAEVLEHPLAGIVELFRVMQFFAEGVNAPHYEYFPQMDACINDALALGNSLPHASGV
jgi:hypothetical protein